MQPPLLMLTKIAIADARGVCFEYAPKRIIREKNNWAIGYFPHHKHGTGGGKYSDDAHMACAVAETLLASGPGAVASDYALHFVDVFKREATPREGYAGNFHQFLLTVQDGDDFLARIQPESEKSGAAMRAGPCGVLGTAKAVLSVAARQAAVTHNTPNGIAAAQAAALMAHYLLYGLGLRENLPHYLDRHVPGYDWTRPHKGDVGALGIESTRAALTALVRNHTLADLLIDCVAFSGDVDTVATIAMAAAACAKDIDQSIPALLWNDLENGAYGRDYLVEVDERFTTFARNQGAPV